MSKNLFKSSTGFTLIELVMTILILGILSAVAMPKFWDNSAFQARGFSDQLLTTLRYAQKTAIAQHRHVCVSLATTTITLTIDAAAVAPINAACDGVLNFSDQQNNLLSAPAGSGITLSPAITINFNALGQATAAADITISNVTAHIFVEKETGYVHQ